MMVVMSFSRDSRQGWLMAAAARNADAAGPPLDAMSADAASGLLCHRSGWEVTLVAAQIHLGSLLLTAEREGEWRTKRVEARLDKGYTELTPRGGSAACKQVALSNTQSSKDNCATKGAQQQRKQTRQGALRRERSALSSCMQAVPFRHWRLCS